MSKKQGFTIIEVVLVLAIGGLIFLMVFLALPTLQRNQRDTQRRNDLDRVAAQITQYSTNNQGRVPFTGPAANENGAWNNFRLNYLCSTADCAGDEEEFRDPNGELYIMSYQGNATGEIGSEAIPFGAVTVGSSTGMPIRIYGSAECSGENAIPVASGTRRVAVRIKLEGSGTYCKDNGA
ncbi:MAG: type II secretion system GspH family protein [Candidatus Nomurabacteria bacterium]|jgi:prepilin-type N-terminal cleavage/methylation domain-containing protein|nr:type II secretion system GspH family protein [Candidatus Nomurabacteria bacterium]